MNCSFFPYNHHELPKIFQNIRRSILDIALALAQRTTFCTSLHLGGPTLQLEECLPVTQDLHASDCLYIAVEDTHLVPFFQLSNCRFSQNVKLTKIPPFIRFILNYLGLCKCTNIKITYQRCHLRDLRKEVVDAGNGLEQGCQPQIHRGPKLKTWSRSKARHIQ